MDFGKVTAEDGGVCDVNTAQRCCTETARLSPHTFDLIGPRKHEGDDLLPQFLPKNKDYRKSQFIKYWDSLI